MKLFPSMLKVVMGLAAVAIGAWLGYAEVSGVYEFYMGEQGALTYVVKAAVGITLASAILPYFLGKAIKRTRPGRAAMVAVGFLLTVAVVFTAAVHRTVHPSDVAEASRKQAERKLEAAEANVKDAEKQLSTDTQLTAAECTTGVGKECKRLAFGGKGTLQATIALRTQLGQADEPVKDSTASTISAMMGGRLSAQQVQTLQPLLVPISVSFLAGLLITVGIEEIELALQAPDQPPRQRTEQRRQWARRLWSWARRRKPEQVQVDAALLPPPVTKMEPAAPRVPNRPRPKLATATRQPMGAVLDFVHDGFVISTGPRTEMADAFIGYATWCARRSLRPTDVATFVEEMEDLCKQLGIRITVQGDRQYLVNVQLAPQLCAATV